MSMGDKKLSPVNTSVAVMLLELALEMAPHALHWLGLLMLGTALTLNQMELAELCSYPSPMGSHPLLSPGTTPKRAWCFSHRLVCFLVLDTFGV